jgi:hypothetical protein
MIFESLYQTGTVPFEDWLINAGKSALYTLEKINNSKTTNEVPKLNDELLAQILYIREYFIINNCFDPHSGTTTVGEIWTKPQHLPRYYLDKLNTITMFMT